MYLLFFFIATLFLIYYIFFEYKNYFNADAATANILADEIIKSNSYFPKDWWYVNGDIWIFFKHTLMLPFAYVGFNNYYSHALVIVFIIFLMLFFSFKLLVALNISKNHALLGLTLIMLSYSPLFYREIYGEAAYSWYFLFFVLFLLFVIKYEKLSKNLKIISFIVLFLMAFEFTLQNPKRFLLYYIIPIVATDFSIYWYHKKQSINKKIYITAGIAFILGLIVREWLINHINMASGTNELALIPLEEFLEHIWFSFIGLFSFIGCGWDDYAKIFSFKTILALIKTLFLPVLLVAPLIYFKKHYKNIDIKIQFVTLSAFIGFGIIFGLYSISTLHFENLYSAKINIRYVIPFLLLIILLNAIFWEFYSKIIKKALLVSLFLGILSTLLLFFDKVSDYKENMRLINTLKANNLKKGYGPYWDSHDLTVLSGFEIEIRPLKEIDGKIVLKPNDWLSSNSWYKIEYVDKDSFIIIPKERVNELEKLQVFPKNRIFTNNYAIYVFDKNPLFR